MTFSLYMAKRYVLSKSSNNAINFISIISAIGVVIASASLFIVLSGFAGLKDFTLQFSSIVDPDLKAEASVGKSFLLSEDQISKLNSINEIYLLSKVIEEDAIVSFGDKNYPAVIKGVDENYQIVNAIDSVIEQGSWLTQKTNQIVVGWGISRNLSFGVLDYGKRVTVYVPKVGKGQITSVKKAFNAIDAINVGIFDINENLNDTYVFAPINFTQRLLNYKPSQVSAIEFKLKSGADEDEARAKIKQVLGNNIIVKNRAQLNNALYKMLNSENLFVYLLLTLVSIMLIFNVAGSLIMMVLDKKGSLNTLFSLGATPKEIRSIFFFQGSIIVIVGGALGVLLGLILVLLQQYFNIIMITPSLPYPVAIKFMNLLIVFSTIYILGIMASRIASFRISKVLVTN